MLGDSLQNDLVLHYPYLEHLVDLQQCQHQHQHQLQHQQQQRCQSQQQYFQETDTMASGVNQFILPRNEVPMRSPAGTDLLPTNFVPGPFDVICARGSGALNHAGNRRYRLLVDLHLPQYSKATGKQEKSKIVSSILKAVRERSPAGGFVRQDKSGRWYEVGTQVAREKTGQVFRDALHTKYSSSTRAKKKRYQEARKTGSVKAPSDDEKSNKSTSSLTHSGDGQHNH